MYRISLQLLLLLIWVGCGNGENNNRSESGEADAGASGLSAFELEYGIGPVSRVLDIGELDSERAQRGAKIFDSKCASCHRMDLRSVGPPLGDVTENRSHEFIINYILNPIEMTRLHPIGQELLEDYFTIMPYQNITQE